MYHTQIKDLQTITWHNLHFILEHYSTEVLGMLESIIKDGETRKGEILFAKQTKQEVISTVKTLKAIHTVLEHHRYITQGSKNASQNLAS